MAPNPQARVKHDGDGTHVGVSGSYIGWGGATPVSVPASVTGTRNNAESALANLLVALESLGLINDTTTAS